jgi:anti-anti-sigma factor
MFIELQQQYDGLCILHCEGSLVPGPEMDYLQTKLDEIKRLACARLAIDFQDVIAIGSMGVTWIVGAYASVTRRPGGRFVLTGVNRHVRQVLDLTRLSTVIPLAPDLASGLAILRSKDHFASPAHACAAR